MRYRVDRLIVDVRADEEEVAEAVALAMVVPLMVKPASVYCWPWGKSPILAQNKFARKARGKITSELIMVKGDEVHGVPGNSSLSGEWHFQKHVIGPLGITEDRYISFISDSYDPHLECLRVGKLLEKRGRFDFMLLGLGHNGHLLFNEHARDDNIGVHVSALSKGTVLHAGLPPFVRYGLTCGLTHIRRSLRVALIACGEHKSEQVARLVHGEISPHFTAGVLRRWGGTLYVDKAAAQLLDLSRLILLPSHA